MQINVPSDEAPAAGTASAAERTVERSLARQRATYADEIERLVTATFELIRTRGELEPRVSEIVAAAGLSNQAFYKHFRSKHELLVAVLDTGVQQLAGYLEHQMAKAGDPVAAVRAWIQGMLQQALDAEAATATRPFVLARGRLADAFPDEVTQSERRLTEPLQAAIAAAREAGALPAADPERDAEALYHLAMGWMQSRLLERREASAAGAARLQAFALAGLGASDPEGVERGT
ncbi:MAG: TetR/AcrR family transcriptional regulator [Proteobacteria bacterium]|nr:TetR/AcrR family transcriptional regulator [Pseudomonadota bacterium]